MRSLTLMSDVTANVPIIDFGLKKKKQAKLKINANKKYIAPCHVEFSSKQYPPITANRGLQFILPAVIVYRKWIVSPNSIVTFVIVIVK